MKRATEHVPLRFVDDREASAILGIATHTLANWRTAGRGPAFHKFEGAVRYEIGELYDYARRQRRTSTTNEAA